MRCKKLGVLLAMVLVGVSAAPAWSVSAAETQDLPQQVLDISNGSDEIYGPGAPIEHVENPDERFSSGGVDHTHQYIVSNGLGVLLLPVILKNWEYSEEELTIVQSAHPAIFALTIIFVLITVFLSMRRPSQKAAKYSAIETAKYTEIKKKIAEKDIRSIRNIAKSNLQRNRKRTTLVFTSLILSIIFVNSLWIISNSFDEEKYINARMRRDYLIASTDTLNPSVIFHNSCYCF